MGIQKLPEDVSYKIGEDSSRFFDEMYDETKHGDRDTAHRFFMYGFDMGIFSYETRWLKL